MHLDSQNYVRWLDYERRMARNEARLKGERHENDRGHKWRKEVLEHPLLADQRTFLGMLSDPYAHFSPEFEGNLAWSEQARSGAEMTVLPECIDTTKRTIHLAFVNRATIHLRLLDVFNAYFKDGLQSDGGWWLLKTTALAIAGELAQELMVPVEGSQ